MISHLQSNKLKLYIMKRYLFYKRKSPFLSYLSTKTKNWKLKWGCKIFYISDLWIIFNNNWNGNLKNSIITFEVATFTIPISNVTLN